MSSYNQYLQRKAMKNLGDAVVLGERRKRCKGDQGVKGAQGGRGRTRCKGAKV